ncbi:MAG: hypothetical protein HYV04_04690 [Deltaproteobacteria bacterium]|nr:hypothetical protein [Deltaproteobacteria bacterium]
MRETQDSKLKTKNRVALLTLVVVAVAGCGYQFSGKGEGFPKDVRTVFIEPFANRSREVGLERDISSALKSEFHRQGQLVVVDRSERADAMLSGVVRTLDRHVVAVNRHAEALQYEAVLVVDITFRRRSPDEVLWQSRGMRLTDVYSASRGAVVTTSSEFRSGTLNPSDVRRFTDIQITETLSLDTKERLMEKFARELHGRLFERF